LNYENSYGPDLNVEPRLCNFHMVQYKRSHLADVTSTTTITTTTTTIIIIIRLFQ
jgi:hypothetical protein